jgi:predicted dehydrogenase
MDSATTLILQTKEGREEIDFEPRDMLMEELDEFAHCVRGTAVPETGAAEALAALEVIRGAIESHESGQINSMKN